MLVLSRCGCLLVLLSILLSHGAIADQAEKSLALPKSLTLMQALALADESHPAIALARAALAQAKAQQLAAQARQGIHVDVTLEPKLVKPSTDEAYVNDSLGRLSVSKSLYDFGQTEAWLEATQANIAGQQHQLQQARLQHQLDIMQYFHAVLLADLRYAVDNETMSARYVKYDRYREYHQLGSVSELELFEAENVYRKALNIRTVSEKQQMMTRQQLAIILNRPEQLPEILIAPNIPQITWQTPDPLLLYEAVEKVNPNLLWLHRELAAAQAKRQAARLQRRPTLSADLAFGKYQRSLSGRNELSVGLTFRLPIYQAGETQAAMAYAAADVATYQARLTQAKQALRQQVLALVQQLEILAVQRQTAQQQLDFVDLNLDKRRALYEMEVQTTLGDAMAKMTESQWLAMKIDLQIALTWARINILLNRSILAEPEEPIL